MQEGNSLHFGYVNDTHFNAHSGHISEAYGAYRLPRAPQAYGYWIAAVLRSDDGFVEFNSFPSLGSALDARRSILSAGPRGHVKVFRWVTEKAFQPAMQSLSVTFGKVPWDQFPDVRG